MSLITSGQFRSEMVPNLQKLISGNISKMEAEASFKNFFKVGTTKYEQYETKIEEASGPAQVWTEGSSKPLITANDGWVKRRAIIEYAARIAYTKRIMKMASPRLRAKLAKILSDSIPLLKEEIVACFMEYGDQTAAGVPTINGIPILDTLSADGQPAFSTAHTHYSDKINTYSNKTASFQALTQATLQNACNEIMGWDSNNGAPLSVSAKKLWVGINNRHKAYELIHSNTKSETANRADNALRQDFDAMDFGVYKRMKDADEWFITTTWENDYCMDQGWGVEQENDYDKQTGTTYLMVDTAFALGVGDPRYIYANKR